MKKFLLSMVALLGMSAVASAADVTLPADGKKWNDYTWTAEGTNYKATVENYSLLLNKGTSTSTLVSPDQYSIRIYAGANLTVTAPEGVTFSKVTVTINATGNKATAATAEGWEVSAFDNGVFTMTSTTPKSSVTFDGAGKQLRVSTIVISDGSGDPTPGPDPDPVETVTKSVKETIALASGTQFTTDYALTVGWVNYSNVFVCDAAGDFIQIYQKDNGLKVGDVIPAGLKGTYTLYNDVTPEIEKVTVLPAATAGTFVPKTVEAADVTTDLVNSVITIPNVVLAEASPATKDNFTGKVGEIELSLRNNYTLESVPAGTYDITVVVTIYQGATSLYVTNYNKSAGIANIAADENAPVEYYNLQGVRIAEPQAGQIVIRRQGRTATKVLVK